MHKTYESVQISRGSMVLVYLLIASIFLDGFNIRQVAGFDFYYYYFIFLIGIIACLVKERKLSIGPTWFRNFILIFFSVSLATGLLFNTAGFLMLKQMAGILFSCTAYWCVFKLANSNLKFICKAYLNIAFLESLYGLIALVLSMLDVVQIGIYATSGSLLGLPKIIGTTEEPYFLAVSLIPAVYMHLNNLFFDRKLVGISYVKSIIVILCFILTGASSGYLAIFLMLAFIAYNKNLLNIKSLGIVVLPLFVYLVYFLFLSFFSNSMDFSRRVNDTWYAFFSTDMETDKANKINASTFALYSNFKVAANSFSANPISGSGIGTHELNYQKYFYNYFSSQTIRRFVAELNKQDANSTFIRLLSETGLFGVFFYILFVVKNLLLKKRSFYVSDSGYFFVLVNQGIFLMIVIRLLRTGNYIGNGFFFFFFCYWAIHKFIINRNDQLKPVSIQ